MIAAQIKEVQSGVAAEFRKIEIIASNEVKAPTLEGQRRSRPNTYGLSPPPVSRATAIGFSVEDSRIDDWQSGHHHSGI